VGAARNGWRSASEAVVGAARNGWRSASEAVVGAARNGWRSASQAVVGEAEWTAPIGPTVVGEAEWTAPIGPTVVGEGGADKVVATMVDPTGDAEWYMTSDIPGAPTARAPYCHEERVVSRRAREVGVRPLNVPLLRVLPGTADAAGKARQLAREFLGAGHPAADTVVLIVSELVTNAVVHSRSGAPGGFISVSLCSGDAGVLIQVRDDGGQSGRWVSAPPGSIAEHGYGLLLVDALADSWGTVAGPQGRVTWCRVSCNGRTTGRPGSPEPAERSSGVGQETKA
jgi:anti-sigma regulatory factor (Ser/Thr protein kinase)